MTAILALGVFAIGQTAVAQARFAYIANAGSGDVSVVNTQTGQVVGEPIPADKGSWAIALTPDGKLAFVANYSASDVSVINTETNRVVGEPIKVSNPVFRATGVAISPDGKTAYVTSEGGFDPGELTSIDVATRQVVGQPIKLKRGAEAIAIAPDGTRAFVASDSGSGTLWLVYPGASSVASQIDVGAGRLAQIAVTPDGTRVLVTDPESNGVSVIDANTFQVIGSPIEVGASPWGLAISPDGHYAYVVNHEGASISVIDISANYQVVDEIPVGEFPTSVTFSPDGNRAYVTGGNPGWVTVIDTKTRQVIGEPIEVGAQPEGIAVVPDQAPVASFSSSSVRLGIPVTFDGLGSTDTDGQIAHYDWNFGDGVTATEAGPTPSHAYDVRGTYQVALTVTDNEGCSTTLVFTGQTAYCNGRPSATKTQALTVARAAHGAAFAARRALVKGGRALLRLGCRGARSCSGIVKLNARVGAERVAGRHSRRGGEGANPRVLIGRSRFAIAAGKTKTIPVRLDRKGRKLLGSAHRHRLKAQLTGTGVRHRVVLLRQAHRRGHTS